jgi:hypothetical protein
MDRKEIGKEEMAKIMFYEHVIKWSSRVVAHEAILIYLVKRAKVKDPDLGRSLQATFDTFLGENMEVLEKAVGASETAAESRKFFEAIVAPEELVAVRPPTLRRRFLNWLERG